MIIFIFIIFFILIIICTLKKSKIKFYDLIISIMRIVLPTISLSFFGQIFETLLLIYLCDKDGISANMNMIKCPNSTTYYILSVFSFFAILFLLIISYISISIYYKPSFMKDNSNSLTKINSFPNIVFFFNKILFIILTNLVYKNIVYTWIVLIILLLSSFINMISFTLYNNYENKLLKELNKFFSIFLFGIIVCLIIGKIFNLLGFNISFWYNCMFNYWKNI